MKTIEILMLVLVGIAAIHASGESQAEKAAVEIARTWLSLVDEGNYAKSWENTSQLFKTAISKTDWEKALNSARKPLGKLVTRELKSATYATSLPGAPDGEYVVIQFQTSFENKKSAVETITPMKDKDGTWRVSGYFIK